MNTRSLLALRLEKRYKPIGLQTFCMGRMDYLSQLPIQQLTDKLNP